MEEKVFNAALAGLLHDIGKLEQRARVDPWNPAPGVERQGQPVHATWTVYFIQTYLPAKYRAAALAGAFHHTPEKSPGVEKHLSELVALADKLSAGERADPVEPDLGKKGGFPRELVTIFDRVRLGDQQKSAGWHYLPLQPLSLGEKAIFPRPATSADSEGNDYQQLCEGFREEARRPIEEPLTFLENLLGALQRYAWSVPSAYYHSIPDVSLYDHSRMTSALAACLADWPVQEIQDLLIAVKNQFAGEPSVDDTEALKKPVALLVGGDLSGLQDFIYTISAKGAARTLRGRSFYLQLLTEAILRFVLNELDLPYTNVIYSGGGHFFLLAPAAAAERLAVLRQEITRKLLRHHSTSLYLGLGWCEVPASGFKIGAFPEYWNQMHRAMARAKQQRYTEIDEEMTAAIFAVPQYGGNPDNTCSVCGEDHREVHTWDIEHEAGAKICTFCRSYADDLGKKLPGAGFVALGFGSAKATKTETALNALGDFGMQVQFLDQAKEDIQLVGAERITVWAFDDPPDNRWPVAGSRPAAHLLRYTVNHTTQLSFDKLQEQVQGGFKRLGVLRMDVDNLGELFKHGFGLPGQPGNLATLARLSTLSFQMSLFFEGWIKYLCEKSETRGLIYAVYAGGDDVFLIGPWDIMPDLALSIRNDFARYTADHPALHLSAGMVFIDGKYPVYQAAEDAADALGNAKNIEGKNAFSFLGQAWPWSKFDQVAMKQTRISRIVGKKQAQEDSLEGPQAIIQILRQLADDEADEAKRRQGRPVWGPWMWMGAYQLTRMVERYENSRPELAKAILEIREELKKENYREINQWGYAARWTQLEVRKENSRKE